MNKIYQKTFPGEKNAGFALIELLVVVLIIGILAGVALPQYEKAVNKSRFSGVILRMRSIINAQELFYMANGYYTHDNTVLDVNNMADCEKAGGTTSMVYYCPYARIDGNNAVAGKMWVRFCPGTTEKSEVCAERRVVDLHVGYSHSEKYKGHRSCGPAQASYQYLCEMFQETFGN